MSHCPTILSGITFALRIGRLQRATASARLVLRGVFLALEAALINPLESRQKVRSIAAKCLMDE